MADHELGHDLGIERRTAPGDAPQRIHEVADIADPVLQEVTDPACPIREELRRILPLDVLAEDEDGGARHAPPRLDRGAQTLVALGGRHPDVDDRDVRTMGDDGLDERRTVADLGDDRPAGLLDQPRDSLADERRVLGDDDAEWGTVHGWMMRAGGALRRTVRISPGSG